MLDRNLTTAYLERFGKGATGGVGMPSIRRRALHLAQHFVDLKKNGLGSLGPEQLEWLEDDLARKSASTPIVIFSISRSG